MSPSTSSVPLFPTFLLPSLRIPFRRRQSSSTSPPERLGQDPIVSTKRSTVPSLSSSPTSTISDSDPVSPSDLETFSFPLDLTTEDGQCKSPPSRAELGTLHRPQPDTIRCGTCAADLAFGAQIVSKGFTGRYGRAFLVSPPSSLSTTPVELGLDLHPHGISKRDVDDLNDSELLNIKIGSRENRQLVTGAHVVADISCAVCGTKVGWKYVEAAEAAQKYKEGKYILETQRVVIFRSWEDAEETSGLGSRESVDVAGQRDSVLFLRQSVDSESDGNKLIAEVPLGKDDNRGQDIVFDSEDEEECEDIFSGIWDPAVVVKRRKTKVARLRGKK
ncbi:yippee-domain-containing protein [Coniochaeta sp. PMI_546]|nr:yippee-domain-containing protein [Coniochaeta sp. PMI_546]